MFLNRLSTRVSDDRNFVRGRRLYASIVTRKFKGLHSRKITSLPEIKNVIRTWRVISIIAENKPHAHPKTHLHAVKVYNTGPVSLLLTKISSVFFDQRSGHLFQSSQRFQAIEFVDRPVPEKL